MASDGSRVWREHRECPPRSPGRQDGLCEGVSVWAETKWLSRSWPCLLAAPHHNLRVYGLGLCEAPCGSVRLCEAPCGSVLVWRRADSGSGHEPKLTAVPGTASAGCQRTLAAAPEVSRLCQGWRVSPGWAEAGFGAECHPVRSWVHFPEPPGTDTESEPCRGVQGVGLLLPAPGRGWGPRARRSLGNLQLHAGK